MSGSGGATNNDEIDLMKLFNIVWSGRKIIAGASAAGLVAAWLYFVSSPPVYQAEGLLQLEERSNGIALTGAMADLMGEKTGATTEISILKSRMVLDRASKESRLDIVAQPVSSPLHVSVMRALGIHDAPWPGLAAYPWGGERIEVSGLTLPDQWAGQKLIVENGSDGAFNAILPDGQAVPGHVGTTLTGSVEGFALLIESIEGGAGRRFVLSKQSLTSATESILNQMTVAETERSSSILRLTLKGNDPRRAEQVLDAVAEAYVLQNISRSAAEAEKSLEFINGQLPIAEEALRKAQAELNSFQSRQQSVDIAFEAQALLERVTDVEKELGTLALTQTALAERVTENHPDYQALLKSRVTLEKQLEELKASVSQLPDTQKEVFNLNRNQELAQQTYVQLLNRAQELQVIRASAIGSVRIIDHGQAKSQPIAPRRSLVLAMGLVLGALCGVAFVAIRQFLRQGVRSSTDLERIGLPVFATINLSDKAADHRKRRGNLPILALSNSDDLVVEAFRSLRTSLHFGMLDAKTNSLMLTSSAPGAGKSFTAVNLATVAAQAGQKVCLIDADLRRGYLRRYFDIKREHPGLADLLAGEASLEDVLIQGPVPGLHFMPTGKLPPNPSELLMRTTFTKMLDDLNATHDLIILDAPPALAVTDPVVMSRSVGASIAVVRHMVTPLGEVEAVVQSLASAGAKLNGAILNGYDVNAAGNYNSRQYHYNYRYSYQSSSPDAD